MRIGTKCDRCGIPTNVEVIEAGEEMSARTFQSGNDKVYGSDFTDVLTLLCRGKSSWLPYIHSNIGSVLAHRDQYSFSVETRVEFNKRAEQLSLGPFGDTVFGVTDKNSGTILLIEFPENQGLSSEVISRPRYTYLLAALHECVHLVSALMDRRLKLSLAHYVLDDGLLEGLVEAVTEDILTGQGITLPAKDLDKLGHKKRLPIAQELVSVLGVRPLASLLFQGNQAVFDPFRKAAFADGVWNKIKVCATQENTEAALALIRTRRSVASPRK